MKLALFLFSSLIFFSCAHRSQLNRHPAFAPSEQSICADAFTMALKYKANAEDVAQDLLLYRQEADLPIILDVGGEGRYVGAINLNPQPITSTTGEAGHIIPNWVPGRGDHIPLPEQSVDVIYLENAPLNNETMEEMLRVMRPRGKIHLSHPQDYADSYYKTLQQYFGESNIHRTNNGMISEISISVP